MTPAGVLSQAYQELTRRGFDTARLHPTTGFNDAFVALWDAPSTASAVHIAVEPPYWFVDAPGHHWTGSSRKTCIEQTVAAIVDVLYERGGK